MFTKSLIVILGAATVLAASITFQANVSESFARDTDRNEWVVGNIFDNSFNVVKDNGAVSREQFSLPPGSGTLGLYYKSPKIYAAVVGQSWMRGFPSKTAGVEIYDRSTNTFGFISLDELSGKESNFCNDLVVADGDIYITDSANSLVYKVTPTDGDNDGNETVFLKNVAGWEPKTSPNLPNNMKLGPNGIEFLKSKIDGKSYLLVGLSLRSNSLYRVELATKAVTEVKVAGDGWAANNGIDGLRLLSDTSLGVVVTLPTGTVAAVLYSSDGWATASLVGVDDKVQTTGANGQFTTMSAIGSNLWKLSTSLDKPGPVTLGPVKLQSITFQASVTESFARDTDRNEWVSGNIFANSFTVVSGTGAVRSQRVPLPDPTGAGTVGLYYKSNKIYAAVVGNSLLKGTPSKIAGVEIWDRATDLFAFVDLSDLSGKVSNFCNDLAVADDGTIYVTDSVNSLVYMVSPPNNDDERNTTVFLEKVSGWEPKPSNNLMLGPNGIEFFKSAGKSYLLVGLSVRSNSLYRVDLATKAVTEVKVAGDGWAANNGIDGLRLLPDGRLGVVVYLPTGTAAAVLYSSDGWATASLFGIDEKVQTTGANGQFTTLSAIGSNLWKLSTSFAGPGPVTLGPVEFQSITFQANVTESFARDTDREEWIAGNIFADFFSVISDGGAVSRKNLKPALPAGAGTVGVYYKSPKVYAAVVGTALLQGNVSKTAGVVEWDRSTGNVTYYDLSTLSGKPTNFCNDLVVADDGAIYVTDSANSIVYMVGADQNKTKSIFLLDVPGWQPNVQNGLSLGANGIEFFKSSGKSYLLVGLSFRSNSLFRVDVEAKTVTPVQVASGGDGWASNNGIDGLRLLPDGRLGVVVNLPNSTVAVLSSRNGWATASLVGIDDKVQKTGANGQFTTLSAIGSTLWKLSTSFAGPGPVTLGPVEPASPPIVLVEPTPAPTAAGFVPTVVPGSPTPASLRPASGASSSSPALVVWAIVAVAALSLK